MGLYGLDPGLDNIIALKMFDAFDVLVVERNGSDLILNVCDVS